MSNALSCPACGHDSTKVTDSRPRWLDGMNAVYRRRLCTSCNEKFSTIEMAGSVRDFEARTIAGRLLALPDERRAVMIQLLEMIG